MLNLAYKKTDKVGKSAQKKGRKPVQDEGSDNPKPNKWKRKNLSLLIFLILALLILMRIMGMKHHEEEISYSQFKQIMAGDSFQFEKLKLRRNSEGYSLTASRSVPPEEMEVSDGESETFAPITKTIKVQLPFSDEVHNQIEEWDKKGIEIEFEKETAWMGWIGSFLPLILIIAFVWFMMSRQTQAGGGPRGIFSFGKSNAKLSNNEKPEVTFVDVAGCDEAKQDLQEIKEFLQDPSKFSTLGGKIPKGVLLLGPPGTGKTLLAKAVAGEADVPFFSMSGSDFVEMFVGVGASRVRDLFDQGKKNSPCIIFIDEIDAVGRHRGAGLGGGHDEREQTLNQLLVEMDGFTQNDGVILLAATNRPDVLDPALLRPGRFDRQIVVDAPDSKGRTGILNVHLKKRNIPLGKDVDVTKIAKATPGLVGADLENLVNEACLMAARFGNKTVTMIDFEEAKDKIMIGTERVSRILTEEEKKTTAYHEAGHALITTFMEHADPLHKITIIPRGRALGVTFSLPEKDMYTMSSDYITDKIAILLGGREAELLLFNQKNTGASNDIQVATDLARKYVCEWGMSDKLGPLSYGKKQEEVFLGKEISQHRDFSEATAVLIDKEVNDIITAQSNRVKELLKKNKKALVNLAEALLEHENLEDEQIAQAIKGQKIDAPIKSRSFIRFKNIDEQREKQKESGGTTDEGNAGDINSKAAKVTDPDLGQKNSEKDGDSGRGLNVDTSA